MYVGVWECTGVYGSVRECTTRLSGQGFEVGVQLFVLLRLPLLRILPLRATPAPRQHLVSIASAPRQRRVSATSAPHQRHVSSASAPLCGGPARVALQRPAAPYAIVHIRLSPCWAPQHAPPRPFAPRLPPLRPPAAAAPPWASRSPPPRPSARQPAVQKTAAPLGLQACRAEGLGPGIMF